MTALTRRLPENSMRRILVLVPLFFWFSMPSMAGPGDPTIRILNAYTNDYLAGAGATNINPTVNAQIALLNQALSDSGVHLNVVSAGVKWMPNLPEDGPLFLATYSQVKNFYPVQKARDDLNADVIIVLAYSGYVSKIKIIGTPYADEAIALIGFNTVGDLGYLHEFGHFLGARHQASGGYDAKYNDSAGIGHGWYQRVNFWAGAGTPKVSYCTHTIMAYEPISGLNGVNCAISEHVMRYSNPAYCDDFTPFLTWTNFPIGCLPWGDGSHNNATVMNSMISTVAGFHVMKLAPRATASFMTGILTSIGLQ